MTSTPPSSLPLLTKSSFNLFLLIANQFFGRIFTFALNTLTLRHVGAIAFGLASIHLYLIYTTILFLAREPFRRATLQVGFTNTSNSSTPFAYQQSLVATLRSISYLVLLIGSILSVALSYIYIVYPPDFGLLVQSSPSQTDLLTSFSTLFSCLISPSTFQSLDTYHLYILSVILFASSAMIELMSEHLYLHTIRISNISLRVGVEATGNAFRCIFTYAFVMLFTWSNILNTGTALIAYSIGQLAFSLVVTFSYFGYYSFHISKQSPHIYISPDTAIIPASSSLISTYPPSTSRSSTLLFSSYSQLLPFLPQFSITNPISHFDWELISWLKAYSAQSIIKHLLTEGEKMILVTFSPFSAEDNGSYVLVSNLGSLFVRIALQPSEENQQQIFSEYHRDLQSLSIEIKTHLDEFDQCLQSPRSAPSTHRIVTRGMNKLNITHLDDNHNENTPKSPEIHLQLIFSLIKAMLFKKQQLFQTLCRSVQLSLSLGLILSIFGPAMAYTAIRLIYGLDWAENSTAPAILAMYSISLVFFALNGVMEGFLNTTLDTPESVYQTNIVYILCSAIYITLLYTFTQYSSFLYEMFSIQGLIIANITVMIIRIFYSFHHIIQYFQYSPIFLILRSKLKSSQNAALLGHLDEFQSAYNGVSLLQPFAQGPPSSYIVSVTTVNDLSLIKFLHLISPSRPLRFVCIISFLSSHLIVTKYFHRGNLNSAVLNVFKMVIKSSQHFFTDKIAPLSPRTISQQGLEYIETYTAPAFIQHIKVIGFIVPFFITFVGLFILFDFRRFQHSFPLKSHNKLD